MSPARQFLFRLALTSGYWTYNPDALLARMPHRVWMEWLEYAKLEPFGEERADWRAGMISATVANCLVREKGEPAFTPDQFMPEFGPPPPPKTPDELYEQVKMINFFLGGEFIDKRKD